MSPRTGSRDLRTRTPRKFVSNPYAWECVKVLLEHLDPRNLSALEGFMYRNMDLPIKYQSFDQFIADVILGKRRTKPVKLTKTSISYLKVWRATAYPLPLTDQLLTILLFLPFNLGLKAVIAKDALIKEGFFPTEYRKVHGTLRSRATKKQNELNF